MFLINRCLKNILSVARLALYSTYCGVEVWKGCRKGGARDAMICYLYPNGGGGQIMPTPLKMPPPLPDFWTFRHLCVDLPANKDEACFCHVACYSLCCCKNSRIIFFRHVTQQFLGGLEKLTHFEL